MKYYIKVFGCQMNYSDAERISTILEKHKLKPAASPDAADLIIFVTCGVRQSAEDRVYGQINNTRKKFPKKKIILTGCLAHRKDVQRRLKGKVNLFCEIKNFPNKIKKILNTRPTCFATRSGRAKYQIPARIATQSVAGGPDTKNGLCNDYLKITPHYTNSHTAYIPIMTGCNNFCAYCVVPHARGREYSRPVEDILKEARALVKKGYKEIILLGQNVNSYRGFYKNKEINFPKLLRLIDNIPAKRSEAPHQTDKGGFGAWGKFWLTFLTSHPKDMSDELIKTIAKSKKVCEYVNLPAQSGNDEILRKMNRNYTVEHYKKLIKKIRQAFLRPSLRKSASLALKKTFGKLPPAISTDIIVGFPGETKKQFENTAKFMRELKFDMAYISQYSPRPETAAWKLKDNIPKNEKARREKVLTDILLKTALENNKKYVGKVVEVLIDKILKLSFRKSESLALGKYKYLARTRTQKKVVFFSNKKIPIGSFVKVKITKAKAFGLEGEIL